MDEAMQANSVDETRQSAFSAFENIKQQAAEMLQQASENLSDSAPAQDPQTPESKPVNQPSNDS